MSEYCPTEKNEKKQPDVVVNILSLDVVVLIASCKVVYFFHGLAFILKGLCALLENKYLIRKKIQKIVSPCCAKNQTICLLYSLQFFLYAEKYIEMLSFMKMPMVVGTIVYPKWLSKQPGEYGAYVNILVTSISKNQICRQISFGWPIRLTGGYTGSLLLSVYPLSFWNIHVQDVNISQHLLETNFEILQIFYTLSSNLM